MKLELDRRARADALASLRRYFEDNGPEPLGELPAGMLLDYFLEEIGPLIYNQAVADAQTRLQGLVADLTGDLYEQPMQYWPRLEKKRRGR